ncbi:hypothetical protein [Legionella waltersii]|uniref:Uncharacterized protein n=1 Tax=Legionella waltersii TaxID=66969 RepID=A0A0W1AND1_9GAMM|nr:hypothetical protein [Legionella waltersii]KTD82839.1 hypothetical protein Lwal_0317 [Legionella waltersii]SNV01693.1 Uncharacterised protein [Legionella waltersii]
MSDFKSKLPDLKELGSMTAKLFNGIKTSVNEIIKDYKDKRAQENPPATVSTEAKTAEPAPKENEEVKKSDTESKE